MKLIVATCGVLVSLVTGCQHSTPGSGTGGVTTRAAALAATPGAAALRVSRPMLITERGVYTSPDGVWRVEVSDGDRGLSISHLRSDGNTTISPSNWTAQAGWFAYVESEARVWAFDGVRDLSLLTFSSNTFVSYGPNRFPCAIPQEVASRLPESVRAAATREP